MGRTRRIPAQAVEFDDRFSSNLRALRRSLELSQQDLADRAGMGVESIALIEVARRGANRRTVTIGEAVVLAQALGVQPAELLKPRQVPGA